ncbi:TolC family protein [Myxococcota bacterium]|nr:TolC family protein [Myxococcota bacterium]
MITSIALSLTAGLASSPSAPLTLEAALARADAAHPRIAESAARLAQARAGHDAARAHFGPKLRLEGNVVFWDDAQTLSLAPAGGAAGALLPPPQTPYEFAVARMVDGFGTPTTTRERVTSTATVQIIQPLVGLYGLSHTADAASQGRDGAHWGHLGARRRTALGVVDAWYRLAHARALLGAAETTVTSLTAQEVRTAAMAEAGLLGRHDVLRVQAALSAARQRRVEADAALRQAGAALAVSLGDAPEQVPDPAPGEPVWAAEPTPALETARARALSERPELQEIRARLGQAEAGLSAARARILPDLNAVGQYQHVEGSKLQAEDAFSAGLFLSWTAFEWGATTAQIDGADAAAAQVRAAEAEARHGIALEVESAWLAHRAATESLATTEAGVAQAEEALRLTRARFDVQQATTADVLDAEAAATTARVQREGARYGRLLALARLRAAQGLPLGGEGP